MVKDTALKSDRLKPCKTKQKKVKDTSCEGLGGDRIAEGPSPQGDLSSFIR